MPPQGHIPKDGGTWRGGDHTAAAYGGFGAVTETPPAGFGYASSDLDDEEVQASGQ